VYVHSFTLEMLKRKRDFYFLVSNFYFDLIIYADCCMVYIYIYIYIFIYISIRKQILFLFKIHDDAIKDVSLISTNLVQANKKNSLYILET